MDFAGIPTVHARPVDECAIAARGPGIVVGSGGIMGDSQKIED